MKFIQAVLVVVVSLSASYCQLNPETTAVISPVGTFHHAILDPTTNTIFNCMVRGAAALVWRVDGIPAEDERIHRNRGITTNDVLTLINNDLQGNITIPNTMVNNQSRVICIAKNIPGIEPPEVNSEPIFLELHIQDFINLSTPDNNLTTSGSTDSRTEPSSMATLSSMGSISMITLCVSIKICMHSIFFT